LGLLTRISPREKFIKSSIKNITGKRARNLDLYILAFTHSSVAPTNQQGFKESNERLEYLGDAILGAVVADYLFKRFPYKDEGFLTEIRARIVNREMLKKVAFQFGLHKIIEVDQRLSKTRSTKALMGDAMEAIIGALYLDRGYTDCKKFIESKILNQYINVDAIVKEDKNFKSTLIEWSQKENKELKFEIIDEKGSSHKKEFTAAIFIDGDKKGEGVGNTKKKAEQAAALEVCKLENLLN
jgi:ribonuclease-3